ncbi:adhesion G -coupled receptor A3 [Brachionus plicatilis]|uniref:Adhesion G-coupled receptor A3 n=1 Tax=Brachionus plicatilis TaxID=10195 RepID=A0A3M7T3H1_BRAPC|nr:adhesion G -coupled receptor A3 [Brachionus plicatilis]
MLNVNVKVLFFYFSQSSYHKSFHVKSTPPYIIPIYLNSTAFAADSNYYYYNSDSLKTSSYDYSDSTSSYDYYDDYYHDVYDDKKNAQTDSEKPPHECPMQCKCIFSESQEQNGHEENLIYESNDDYEHEAEESYRKKRTLNSSYDYDDYSYDYSTKSPVAPTKRKYDIYIDCSSQNLNSISYLFAYDFPLDQIISLTKITKDLLFTIEISFQHILKSLIKWFEFLIYLCKMCEYERLFKFLVPFFYPINPLIIFTMLILKKINPPLLMTKSQFKSLKNSINLSNNRFRVLRLDDGFEDLINLRILDISSNNYLRSPSPKYFLKKFRHLEKILMNNLDQINCDQALNSNKLVSIDCKWLRTILYLFKRNVSVIIDKPNRCDVNKLVNSVSLMSRCFRDLYNSYRFTETNQTLLRTDNSKFEFRIEPELNQILIEGDTLELTCKLKKINLLKKFRHRSSNFYKSQIKWFLNEQTQLMISTIYYTKDTPTQIQIVENKSKFKLDDLIESKLIITNTISGQHTGKYSCVAGLYLNEKRLNVNTSRVEIKVLTRHQLNVIEPSVQETKQKSPYCPEIITQTYKGIFKWPRTLANSKITQKCSGANSSAFAIFECKQDGQWSDFMDLSACFFESNLTKYLFGLEKGKKEIDLEEFIRQIISIQSNHNTSVKQSLNKFDVINVQKNRSEVLDSNSWKHEFMFLNDMLSKLNEFYLIQAKLANLEVYGNYFFNVLMEVLGSSIHSTQGIQSDLLSSYLAMHSISANTNRNLKNKKRYK